MHVMARYVLEGFGERTKRDKVRLMSQIRRIGQIRPISRIGRIGRIGGGRGFPKCQCSLCHDWFRGKDGSDISDGSDGVFFPGTPFTSQSDVRTSGWRVPGGRGSFSGGGAVMAPLRRAGLRGSLPVLGDRSDLGLRGREGCREGLPFRSALLREADRAAVRGRDWATGGLGDGSRW